MTRAEYDRAVIGVVALIVKNNAGGVARALRDAGYTSKYDKIPESELEAELLKLHALDKNKFYAVMNNIPWNYGDTATNKPEIRDRIMGLVKMNNPNVNTDSTTKSDWWGGLLNLLSGSSAGTQISTTYSRNTTAIVALAVLGISLVIGLFFLIKS